MTLLKKVINFIKGNIKKSRKTTKITGLKTYKCTNIVKLFFKKSRFPTFFISNKKKTAAGKPGIDFGRKTTKITGLKTWKCTNILKSFFEKSRFLTIFAKSDIVFFGLTKSLKNHIILHKQFKWVCNILEAI